MPMEADWDQLARTSVPLSGPLALTSPATALAFDDSRELLWVGTDQVCLSHC